MVEWTGGTLPTFVTHLECSLTGERYPADTLQTLSKAGRPLLVRYDLNGVRRALTREMLADRPQTLRRYRELSSQGKWAEAGRELEAIEAEVRR